MPWNLIASAINRVTLGSFPACAHAAAPAPSVPASPPRAARLPRRSKVHSSASPFALAFAFIPVPPVPPPPAPPRRPPPPPPPPAPPAAPRSIRAPARSPSRSPSYPCLLSRRLLPRRGADRLEPRRPERHRDPACPSVIPDAVYHRPDEPGLLRRVQR